MFRRIAYVGGLPSRTATSRAPTSGGVLFTTCPILEYNRIADIVYLQTIDMRSDAIVGRAMCYGLARVHET
jgi:hypothetical protein